MKDVRVASLFNEEFWKMMSNVSDDDQRLIFLSWGKAVLAEFQTVDAGSLGEVSSPCFKGCMLALHGILSLLNATLGFGLLDAVHYIVPGTLQPRQS